MSGDARVASDQLNSSFAEAFQGGQDEGRSDVGVGQLKKEYPLPFDKLALWRSFTLYNVVRISQIQHTILMNSFLRNFALRLNSSLI